MGQSSIWPNRIHDSTPCFSNCEIPQCEGSSTRLGTWSASIRSDGRSVLLSTTVSQPNSQRQHCHTFPMDVMMKARGHFNVEVSTPCHPTIPVSSSYTIGYCVNALFWSSCDPPSHQKEYAVLCSYRTFAHKCYTPKAPLPPT